MFTRKEKNMLFDPYFEVIRETEQFIEVRSVNTGHCWSVFKNIYNAPRKITLYHKHKESDRYFHGLELPIVAECYVVRWLFRPAVTSDRTEVFIVLFNDIDPSDVATVRLLGSQGNDIHHV